MSLLKRLYIFILLFISPNDAILCKVGRLFSGVAILSAVAPLLSNPVYRKLYDLTLDTFPSAFLLLSASIALMQFCGNFVVFTQRKRIKRGNPGGHNIKLDETAVAL